MLAGNDENSKVHKLYEKVQIALFDLGSRLACEESHWEKYNLPQIDSNLITELEKNIDELDNELEPLRSFILPGGSQAAATTHVTRTRCRKVERLLVLFKEEGHNVPKYSLELLNRLSDHLFIYARYLNKVTGKKEKLWLPSQNA